MVRGKVAETTVVSISRAYNINPVAALASFDPYSDLASSSIPPTDKELVSQIATVDLLRAVIAAPHPKAPPAQAPRAWTSRTSARRRMPPR